MVKNKGNYEKGINFRMHPLRFYNHHDEELFFQWLKKIECIKEFRGVGNALSCTLFQKY